MFNVLYADWVIASEKKIKRKGHYPERHPVKAYFYFRLAESSRR